MSAVRPVMHLGRLPVGHLGQSRLSWCSRGRRIISCRCRACRRPQSRCLRRRSRACRRPRCWRLPPAPWDPWQVRICPCIEVGESKSAVLFMQAGSEGAQCQGPASYIRSLMACCARVDGRPHALGHPSGRGQGLSSVLFCSGCIDARARAPPSQAAGTQQRAWRGLLSSRRRWLPPDQPRTQDTAASPAQEAMRRLHTLTLT